MNKTILCTLFSLSFSLAVNAQQNKDLSNFYLTQDTARYFEKNGQDKEAISCYKRSLRYTQFEIYSGVYNSIFELYLKQGNLDSAKKYLGLFIVNSGPVDNDWYDYHTKGRLNINVDSLNNLFSFDYRLFSEITKTLWEDQALRKIDFSLRRNNVDEIIRARIFDQYDSINYAKLKKIVIDNKHIPTAKQIGWHLQDVFTMVLMVHHFPKDTTFWSPLYRSAINNGTVVNYSLPFLIDKYYLENTSEEKPLYCEYPNYDNPAQILDPLSPDKVDQLRAEFYLSPLYKKAQIGNLKLPSSYHHGQ